MQICFYLRTQGFLFCLYEAWGVVIHEAVLSGLPVITTKQTSAASDLLFTKWIYL